MVQAIATREVGLAVVALGGGRTRPQDAVDHTVGFTDLAGLGEAVDQERPLAVVHAATETQAEAAAQALRQAYTISDQAPGETPLILERIGDAA
jgi:thymidine phosphorylase